MNGMEEGLCRVWSNRNECKTSIRIPVYGDILFDGEGFSGNLQILTADVQLSTP